MAGETVGFDPDRDNAIGGALLNTEHIGGTARRAPHFVRELEAVGWTVVPTAAAPLFISLGAMCDAVAAYLGGTGTLAELADCASVARGFLADSPLSRATPERSADEVDG